MRIDRRSALIGTASIALGLGTSQACAQISVGQAPAKAVAATRAEHDKLAAPCDAQFVGLASATAPRGEVGSHPCQGIYWTPKGERPRVALIATHYNVRFHRALSRALHRDAGLRLPRLEHALSRRRGPVHAGACADRHRRRREMAARAGRRARRDPRQFGRRLADGRLSGRSDRADACRRHAGRGPRRAGKPAEGRSLHFAQRAFRPAGGADQLARPVGDRRARSGRDRPVAQHVQQGERPALLGRVHRALSRRAEGAQPAHHRLVQGGTEAPQRGGHSGLSLPAVPRLGRPALHGRAHRSVRPRRAGLLSRRSGGGEPRLRARSRLHAAQLALDVEPGNLEVPGAGAACQVHDPGAGDPEPRRHGRVPERCAEDVRCGRLEGQVDSS